MEGRLCCLKYRGDDSIDSASRPREGDFLLELFPRGSSLFSSAILSDGSGIVSPYVSWIIVVVTPDPLSKQWWHDIWISVSQKINLPYFRPDRLELVEAGQELDTLDRWESWFKHYCLNSLALRTGHYFWHVQTGSLLDIRNALQLTQDNEGEDSSDDDKENSTTHNTYGDDEENKGARLQES
jgi:hypothetical protein